MLRNHEATATKAPEISLALDDLGPLEVLYLGIDANHGMVLADSSCAIAFHLQKRSSEYFKEVSSQRPLNKLVGCRMVLNPNGTKIEPKPSGPASPLSSKNIKINNPVEPKTS